MAAKKSDPKFKRLIEVFARAEEDVDEADWPKATSALVAAIREASADDIDAIFRLPVIGDAMLDEDQTPSEVAVALFQRAESMDAADAGRVLGWLGRGIASTPLFILRPNRDPRLENGRKRTFLDVIEKQLPLLRSWLAGDEAERRTAAAHLLAWCGNTTVDDIRSCAQRVTGETDPTALATELFALGVLWRRWGAGCDARERAQLVELASSKLSHKSALVRMCAATAVAFLEEPLSKTGMEALADHVTKPVKLPREWGWHSAEAAGIKSDAFSSAVLTWVRTDSPEPAVTALAAKDVEKQSLGFMNTVADGLIHLAFESHGAALPRLGVVAADLSPLEREALKAFERGKLRQAVSVKRLGIPGGDAVQDFLAGKGPEWAPITIDVHGATKRWHYARLWAAVVVGDIDVRAARDAVVASLSPDDTAWLATVYLGSQRPLRDRLGEGVPWEREQDLALALLNQALARGVDLTPRFRNPDAVRGSNATILAIAFLRTHTGAVPAEFKPLMRSGILWARHTEPLRSLLASLPQASLQEILHDAPGGNGGLRFMDLCLDEVVVKKLVVQAFEAPFHDRAMAILVTGGASVAQILRTLRFDKPALDERAQPIIKAALEAIERRG